VGQERLGPSYFFVSLVLGPLNSLFFFFTRPRPAYALKCRGSESSTNKQHYLSFLSGIPRRHLSECTCTHSGLCLVDKDRRAATKRLLLAGDPSQDARRPSTDSRI
jgi:hypothetical protein